jgi:imidazolonepropionase-like amidohydrolase
MGVEWEWRKALYDAEASERVPERAFPGSDVLRAVLRGEHTLFVEAWTTQDIRTAVFLKEEIERESLGRPTVILDACAEAWREPELLVRSGVSVVLPPFPVQGRTSDGAFMTLETPKLLHELGVPIALSGHGARDPAERLSRQVGLALRGGLPFDAALAAVTIAPARMVGIDDRVGSLAVDKDADLVLWSGKPFEAASSVVGVLVDGRLILDPRPSK